MKKTILFVLISLAAQAEWKKIESLAAANRSPWNNDEKKSVLGYFDVTALPDDRIMFSFGFHEQAVRDELFYQFFPTGYSTPLVLSGLGTFFGGQIVLSRQEAGGWLTRYQTTPSPFGQLPVVRIRPRVMSNVASVEQARETRETSERRAERPQTQQRGCSMAPVSKAVAKY